MGEAAGAQGLVPGVLPSLAVAKASPAALWLSLQEEEVMGEALTFSPAWILKHTPRTAIGSSGRCLSPKSRNSICPL